MMVRLERFPWPRTQRVVSTAGCPVQCPHGRKEHEDLGVVVGKEEEVPLCSRGQTVYPLTKGIYGSGRR